ncbi:MAG: hypothetical protein NTW31_00575 [Bacteroidetes bacterium]|nr:hypothetical protein [Bacteroidota bacterium]
MISVNIVLFVLVCISILLILGAGYLIYTQGRKTADKSDIRMLTDILSQIHDRNMEENDLLKSNLNIHTGQNNHIFNERKNAILAYFSSLNTWMWDGLNISVQDYNHVNFEELTRRVTNIKEYYNQANISFAVMQLTIDSEQLVKLGYEAMMDTLKLHHFVENTMKNYKKTLSWEKTLLDKITSKDYDFFKLSPDMKSFYERQARENEEEKRKVLEGYNDRHWELFKQAIADRNLFRDVAKEELAELENEVYSKPGEKTEELTNILNGGISQAKNIKDLSARHEYAYTRTTENKF